MSSVGPSQTGRRAPEELSQPANYLRDEGIDDDLDGEEWPAASGAAPRDLNYAILSEADLRGSNFSAADLTGAELSRADLRQANLQNAILWGACLRGARLEGTNLHGAELHLAILKGATFNTETRWPAGFEPQARGAVLSEG